LIVGTSAYRLGLTGGIGSGKTTVAGMLAVMGATVVDADAISRAATEPGGSAIAMLKSTFGGSMLAADGSLDREQMRTLIYSDPTAKARLENIVHPLVGQEIARQAQRAEARGATCIVFDIPLLVESKHWRATLQRILVIDCSERTQIERVTARNGLDTASVTKILAAQASRTQRLDAADMVIFNDGIDMNVLALQVHEIGTQFGL
jgi:dephospho-CoA kinase